MIENVQWVAGEEGVGHGMSYAWVVRSKHGEVVFEEGGVVRLANPDEAGTEFARDLEAVRAILNAGEQVRHCAVVMRPRGGILKAQSEEVS